MDRGEAEGPRSRFITRLETQLPSTRHSIEDITPQRCDPRRRARTLPSLQRRNSYFRRAFETRAGIPTGFLLFSSPPIMRPAAKCPRRDSNPRRAA